MVSMPRTIFAFTLLTLAFSGLHAPVWGQVVPGTGTRLTQVGDDFEDENWTFTLNLPKASSNLDRTDRQPAGFSSNQKWFESMYRGTPDIVKRVPTPPGGLVGSKGAMALRTVQSGVPGQLSYKFQQDDLLANMTSIGFLPVNRSPSIVVRLYLPPFEQWEKRTGSHFGVRSDCVTIINKPSTVGRLFRSASSSRKTENYWPGFFIQFNSKHDSQVKEDSAMILIRSGSRGEDLQGPMIREPGWWTLGMSFTPDGQVHYYGKPGVGNLTAADHLKSTFPYGYTAMQVNTFFFNVVNQDDSRSWSTEFVVDDVAIYALQ